MKFEALTDFRLVARHGSFAKASREAGRPKATLSRHVVELEDSLGVRLFERDRHGLRLTAEGDLLNARSSTILAAVDDVRDEISQSSLRPHGRLRIGAPMLFSHTAMGWITAKFLIEFPEIDVDIVIVEHPIDIAEEGFDLIIRANPQPRSDLVGRCFLRDHVVFVAASSLHDSVREADDELTELPIILPSGTSPPAEWKVQIDGLKRSMVPRAALHLPSRLMIRDAVLTGLGAAELPFSIVSADLSAGRLVSWGRTEHDEIELWYLRPSSRHVNRRVRAFIEFLHREFPGAQVDAEKHDRYTRRSLADT